MILIICRLRFLFRLKDMNRNSSRFFSFISLATTAEISQQCEWVHISPNPHCLWDETAMPGGQPRLLVEQ